jgi:transcriptional regulator with XRE-family HTH domain
MNINERIKHLVPLTTGGKQRVFARKTGVGHTTLNGIVGSRQSDPSFSTLKKICDAHPSLNNHWLIKEEGEPFLSDYQKEEELLSLYNKIHNSTFLSGNLKLLREHIHESQGSFARIFGISRDNIASYERGSKPDLPLIIQIVKHFHIHLDDFISRDLKEHPEILEKILVPDSDKGIKKPRKSSSK